MFRKLLYLSQYKSHMYCTQNSMLVEMAIMTAVITGTGTRLHV